MILEEEDMERQHRGESNLIIVNNKIVARRTVLTTMGSVDQTAHQQATASPSVDNN